MNRPEPWTEVIGTVQSVVNGKITVVCRTKVTLNMDSIALAKWIHLLQPGRCVAILVLEDGTVAVRQFDADGASKTSAKPHVERQPRKGGHHVSSILAKKEIEGSERDRQEC